MLQALGWRAIEGAGDEVHYHGYAFRENVHGGLPDCVVYLDGRAYAVFELKPLGYGTIDKDPAVVARLQMYCQSLGCRFQMLTRMYQAKLYDNRGSLKVDISVPMDYVSKFDAIWDLLSREGSTSHAILHSAKHR